MSIFTLCEINAQNKAALLQLIDCFENSDDDDEFLNLIIDSSSSSSEDEDEEIAINLHIILNKRQKLNKRLRI